ncbi:hypothetical protein EGW08_011670 [Elysia chlorotica]|uniref:Methylosome subunit pICln n=1 Tax=Elysia chlorotica TaxID=188477 RepID=A0A433TGB4_ELYCH|nr:hypothetical protein EGW08_011670 [Elysia chlorotica]
MVSLIAHMIPEDGIQHTEPNVAASVGPQDIGIGTLYITESFVLWLTPQGQGLQLEYRQICLHAISRDLQACPKEHLLCHYEGKLSGTRYTPPFLDPCHYDYEGKLSGTQFTPPFLDPCHYEGKLSDPGSVGDMADDEDNDDDSSESDITEIRFAPDNKDSLDAMFKALATCQTLHPDSDCQLSDDGDFEDADEIHNFDEMAGGDVMFSSEEGFQHLTAEGRATMERLNQMLSANQQLRQAGSGDADIVDRTNQMHITNGHPSNGEAQMDADQFVDADDDKE